MTSLWNTRAGSQEARRHNEIYAEDPGKEIDSMISLFMTLREFGQLQDKSTKKGDRLEDG